MLGVSRRTFDEMKATGEIGPQSGYGLPLAAAHVHRWAEAGRSSARRRYDAGAAQRPEADARDLRAFRDRRTGESREQEGVNRERLRENSSSETDG